MKKISDELKKDITNLANEGEWWKCGGEYTFNKQARFLKTKGLTEEEIINHLQDVFNAVAGEFGN